MDRRQLIFGGSSFSISYFCISNIGSLASPLVPPEVIAAIKAEATLSDVTVQSPFRYGVFNRIFKTKKLTLSPGAILSMEELDPDWIAIAVRNLNIEDIATITRTDRYVLDGKGGNNGKSGSSGHFPGQSGYDGSTGENGLDGQTRRSPEVFIFIERLTVGGLTATPSQISKLLTFSFDGYPGGNGGIGGRGGDGGNGVKGVPARSGWFDCSAGAGYGGNGGNAAQGGLGGRPGVGGDAANLYLLCPQAAKTALSAAIYSLKGGAAGQQGGVGAPGKPGHGGRPGDAQGNCQEEKGRAGRDGIVLPRCYNADYPRFPGNPARVVQSDFISFDDLFS